MKCRNMKKYLLKIKWYLFLTIIGDLLETFATSLMLYLPGYLIDHYTEGTQKIISLIIFYIFLFVLYLFSAYFGNRMADYRRVKFEKAIKKDYFNAVLEKEYEDYNQLSSAEYISMQANDITELCQNYLSPLMAVIRNSIMIVVFGACLVIFVDPSIAITIILFSILVMFVPEITSKELSERNSKFLEMTGKYTKKIQSYFESKDILDYKSIQQIEVKHEKDLDAVLESNMFFRKLNSFSMVINGGSAELVSVVAFICVAFLLCNGRITIGMATVGFMYCTKFMDPIYELNVNIGRVKSTKKIQEKLFEILNQDHKKVNLTSQQIKQIQTSSLTKSFTQVDIQLPNVTFNYPNKYLVLGENGAGKSVLLKMLLGFMKPSNGEVLYDPEDIIPNESICYVPQKPLIFEGSYLDNISVFGTYDCKNLNTYEQYFPSYLIEQIKSSTDLNSLSGGEKQILCLLRALCSEKNVLILDEPFSAMNNIVIECFMSHLKDINKLVIFVAHNMNQYTDVFDEVYELKDTRIDNS